jgi:hypothetical protein
MTSEAETANRTAVERMIAARPHLVAVAPAGEVVPGLDRRMLLHAGPPLGWARMSGPLKGATIGAALLEGWARDAREAQELLASGEVRFDSCHHHACAGPMAGVVSPSMAVYVVEERTHGGRFFSTLNEGSGKVLRFGAYSTEVLDRLRWLNGTLGPLLDQALANAGALDLHALVARALESGDELHCRSEVGSLLLFRHLAPAIAGGSAPAETRRRALATLGGNWLAVLNPVMAACKAICDAGHGVAGSTVVTRLARNGTEFGIRVSGAGERWFVGPAEVPVGVLYPGRTAEECNPDLGDSAITECAGIGAFAMAAGPAIAKLVGGTAEEAIAATHEMYRITLAEHPDFRIPALGFRGTPTGIDARKVVETGIAPRINTGIAHRDPGVGQVGFGLVRAPLEPFREAVAALARADH